MPSVNRFFSISPFLPPFLQCVLTDTAFSRLRLPCASVLSPEALSIVNPRLSGPNLSGSIIWAGGEGKLSSTEASDTLLIILSAVSSSAELLSSEIKTFVNFIAQQRRQGVTIWEGEQGWADERARREQSAAWTALLFALSSRTYWGPGTRASVLTVIPSAP